MKIERLALTKMTPLSSGLALDEIQFLRQFVQRAQVKNVRGRTGPVKRQHANSVIAHDQVDRFFRRRRWQWRV